jgi:hypothetical protein
MVAMAGGAILPISEVWAWVLGWVLGSSASPRVGVVISAMASNLKCLGIFARDSILSCGFVKTRCVREVGNRIWDADICVCW